MTAGRDDISKVDLRLSLDDTDFDTLVETARATIAAQSPAWTDHNIHDPGIMLSELMAWVADFANLQSVKDSP